MLNFDNMNLDQLLRLADDNFYEKVTTEDQFIDYITSIFYKTCLINGMSTNLSSVFVANLQQKDYALFSHVTNKLYLNKRFFDLFDECKKEKNLFLPFRMIQTALHEARHFSQFNCRSKVDEYLKDYAQFSLYFLDATVDMHYNTNPMEVDAKHYAYSILQAYPPLNKYQSHKAFYNGEYQHASGYSSIFTALLKANSIMKRDGVTDVQKRVYNDLNIDCEKFLAENNIDIKEFCKSVLQLKIRQDEIDRLTNRPTENTLIQKVSTPLKQELLLKIFTDKILTSEDLLKCKEKLLSLNTRLPVKEFAFYEIKFDTFRARETRALYRRFAPKFLDFGKKARTAPSPPREEIEFNNKYNADEKSN